MRGIVSLIVFMFVFTVFVQAQNERKHIREGNKFYEMALKDTSKLDTTTFSKAETAYRKALDKKPDDVKWDFNLADALYKQMKFEESAGKFEQIAEKTTDKIEKGKALHNLGNSLLMQNKLDESIEAYKKALRNNPNDIETKYNLAYAQNLKKKQQQQQQQQDQQNKDQNKDQDKNKDKQNQQQQQDKDKQEQKNNQDQQQQQQQQQQQSKISKENAERMLQALENDEKKIQEKVKKEQAKKARSKNIEKDW